MQSALASASSFPLRQQARRARQQQQQPTAAATTGAGKAGATRSRKRKTNGRLVSSHSPCARPTCALFPPEREREKPSGVAAGLCGRAQGPAHEAKLAALVVQVSAKRQQTTALRTTNDIAEKKKKKERTDRRPTTSTRTSRDWRATIIYRLLVKFRFGLASVRLKFGNGH